MNFPVCKFSDTFAYLHLFYHIYVKIAIQKPTAFYDTVGFLCAGRKSLLLDLYLRLGFPNMLDDMLRTLLCTCTAMYALLVINTRNVVDNGDRSVLAGLFT